MQGIFSHCFLLVISGVSRRMGVMVSMVTASFAVHTFDLLLGHSVC